MKTKITYEESNKFYLEALDNALANFVNEMHEGGAIMEDIAEATSEELSWEIEKEFEKAWDDIIGDENLPLARIRFMQWWITYYPQFAADAISYVDDRTQDYWEEMILGDY